MKTAAERYLAAVFTCHHQPESACVDCMVAALIAHAEAVREEAKKRIEVFQDILSWQAGESRNKLIWDIEQSVGAIEVK